MFARIGGVPRCGSQFGRPTFVRSKSFHTNRVLNDETKQQYKPPRPIIRVKPQDPKKIAMRKLNWSVESLSKHLEQINQVDKERYEEQQRIKSEAAAKSKAARKIEKKKAREEAKIQTEKRAAIEREQRALEQAERKEKLRVTSQLQREIKKEFLEVLMEDITGWEYHPKELVYKRYEFSGQLPPKMQQWMQNNVSPSLEKFKTNN